MSGGRVGGAGSGRVAGLIRAFACWSMLLMHGWALASANAPVSKVQIIEHQGGYQLQVNGRPFYVKGAGLDSGSQEQLAAHGGNSLRTWRTDRGNKVLDRAQRNGLMVAMGIEIARERHGFDYDDKDAVARQFARVRKEVLRLKDHPALLIWIVGNELNLEASNPRVWNAVNQIAEWIHQVDPNHPVMSTVAGFDAVLADELRRRASALDLIGIQLYGDIAQLPQKLRDSNWTGPYIVTEWGPTGHWEVATTAWGAPIEEDSTRKAENLVDRYQRYIASDTRQCLGSYVFLWGQKQERTPTWYGLFLLSGEATAGVDAMRYLWTGTWPDNRSPVTTPLSLNGRWAGASIDLSPGQSSTAEVTARDLESDALTYRWRILRESEAQSIGGDREEVPRVVPVRFTPGNSGVASFRAPRKSGAYRLFVTVHDGHEHAAHANIPFRVVPAD